jgi:hypothetical protein
MRLVVDTFEFGSSLHSVLQHHFHLGLRHLRGWLDGAAGTGLHHFGGVEYVRAFATVGEITHVLHEVYVATPNLKPTVQIDPHQI